MRKITPLPPLSSLVAFESTARHLSFTVAGEELNVTQSAISRHIRQLEDYLGQPLFVRANRAVQLTPTGMQFYLTVHASLTAISNATKQARLRGGDQQITVMTSTAMASLWLLPKVAAFQHRQPEINLRIVASDGISDLSRINGDLALFYCSTPPADMCATPLFLEEVFPVCSPGYLTRIGAIAEPAQLAAHTLLVLDEGRRDWMSWRDWFRAVGVPAVEPRKQVRIFVPGCVRVFRQWLLGNTTGQLGNLGLADPK